VITIEVRYVCCTRTVRPQAGFLPACYWLAGFCRGALMSDWLMSVNRSKYAPKVIANYTSYEHDATTRRVQKVRRLTQLLARCVRHILSLFNTVSCNRNALGPAFFQSSNSVVEELLILLFQPAVCRADFPVKITPLHGWI